MVTTASLTKLSISRRTTLRMALAAAFTGKLVELSGLVAAQDASTGTWNWGGNAGHTGELPGPGLDLDGALGELWRAPRDDFGYPYDYYGPMRVSGYLNGVMYTSSGGNLWARRLKDGELLWTQSLAKLGVTPVATPTPMATPQVEANEIVFTQYIAIDNDIVLVALNNGHLLALDAKTGDLRWDFDLESDYVGAPTVVDHVAYCGGGNVYAIELGEQPTLRWRAEGSWWVLGVEDGLVYITDYLSEVRALTVEDGSEFWRVSFDDFARYWFYGADQSGLVFSVRESGSSIDQLIKFNRDGQVAWNVSRDHYDAWILNEAITALIRPDGGYGPWRFQALFAENGQALWELELNTGRWPESISWNPVVCAGKAYALVRDAGQQKNLLLVVDPISAEVFGAWDSLAIPLFVADGVMLAQDYDTDEILAIGAVPPVLQSGGRATVTEDTTLRGAPSDTAIERAQVTAGTLVDVTGEIETSSETEWVPVTERETGKSGWLPVDVLVGQDGAIKFSALSVHEFGRFTSYPKFTSGTKAEITNQVDLRGAPSASSALKATLDAGTVVTVTSPPTTADDGEWCPIRVDATEESGWVPIAVLKLVPLA